MLLGKVIGGVFTMFMPGMYAFVDAWEKAAAPWKPFFDASAKLNDAYADIFKGTPIAGLFRAASTNSDVISRLLHDYPRPPFDIQNVEVNGEKVRVSETNLSEKTFGRRVHFTLVDNKGDQIKRNVPKILLVAPMSGHYATLLRKTVIGLLPHADVSITDWKNAKNIPVSEGKFDMDDFSNYLREWLQEMGPNAHVISVCQPCPITMATIAQMEEDGDENTPLSMTLMGGPVEPSANPTDPVKLAKTMGMPYFKALIDYVPFGHKGVGRKVYAGWKQLTAFVSMNTQRHIDSGKQYVVDLQLEDFKSAKTFRQFYDEFLAVMDMTAEFYLQTINKVFIKEELPNGEMELNGRRVDLDQMRNTVVMTVEGEKDDISAPTQCSAAHDLCPNVPDDMKFAHLEPDAGHYGIFSGKAFRNNIVEKIIAITHMAANQKGIEYDPVNLDMPKTWNEAQMTDYAAYWAQEATNNNAAPALQAA